MEAVLARLGRSGKFSVDGDDRKEEDYVNATLATTIEEGCRLWTRDQKIKACVACNAYSSVWHVPLNKYARHTLQVGDFKRATREDLSRCPDFTENIKESIALPILFPPSEPMIREDEWKNNALTKAFEATKRATWNDEPGAEVLKLGCKAVMMLTDALSDLAIPLHGTVTVYRGEKCPQGASNAICSEWSQWPTGMLSCSTDKSTALDFANDKGKTFSFQLPPETMVFPMVFGSSFHGERESEIVLPRTKRRIKDMDGKEKVLDLHFLPRDDTPKQITDGTQEYKMQFDFRVIRFWTVKFQPRSWPDPDFEIWPNYMLSDWFMRMPGVPSVFHVHSLRRSMAYDIEFADVEFLVSTSVSHPQIILSSICSHFGMNPPTQQFPWVTITDSMATSGNTSDKPLETWM
tara:strand:+ start:227 stop:1444 length:1218 start_codon:yes stop_codon:yes gene_type:complete